MRLLVQRVKEASVLVDQKVCGQIAHGLLLYLGVHKEDSAPQIERLVKKVVHFRIFPDEDDKMNLDVQQAKGNILVISQFTLCGTGDKGRRPEFTQAASPDIAQPLYEQFAKELSQALGKPVETGIFGAYMQVSSINDGPVTFLLES